MLYLDSPVTFNDVTFYRDFSDEKLFYYLPNDVLIGKDAESLHFTSFINGATKSQNDEQEKEKDNSEVNDIGGLLSLESVLGPDSNDMKEAIDALKGYAGQDVRVTPVPFEDGEVNIAIIGKSSKNKEGSKSKETDLMEVEIVAAEKPCLTGNHQAAFGSKLKSHAAQVVEDLLRNTPQTQMVVFYKMDYLGVTPAYNLEITVDFEATEKYYNNKIDLDFDLEEKSKNLKILVDADIDSIIQDLVNEGTITIKETDYTEGHRFNEGVTNLVELIKTLLGTELFNPTIMPTSPNAILKDTIHSAGDNKDAKDQGKSGEGKDAKGGEGKDAKGGEGKDAKGGGSIPDKKNDAIPEGGKKPGKTNPATNDNPTPEAPKSANPKATAPKGENPDGENPAGKNPTGENPDGENPDGENPGGKKPDGKKPTGKKPTGENPDGENPDGENPDGENPGGKNPTDGDASTDGDNPDGKNPTDGDNPDGDNNGDDSNGGETDDKKKSELYITAKLGYTLRHRDLSEQVKRTFTFNRHEVKRMPFTISGMLSTAESKFDPEKQIHTSKLDVGKYRNSTIIFTSSPSFAEYGITKAIVDWHYQDMKLWDSVMIDKEDGVYKRSLIHNDDESSNIICYKTSFLTKDFGTLETEELTTDNPRIIADLNNLAGKQFVKVHLGAFGKPSDIYVKVMPDGNEAAMKSVCLTSEKTMRPVLIDKCETYDVVVEYPQGSGEPRRVTYHKQTGTDFIVNNSHPAVQVVLDESAFADDTVRQIRVKLSYNDGPSKTLVFTPTKLEASFIFDYEANTLRSGVIKTSYQKIHADRTIEDNGGEEYPGDSIEINPIIF